MSVQRVPTKMGYAYKVRVRKVDPRTGAVTHPSRTFKTKKEAERVERAWQIEIDRGTAIDPSTMTIADLARAFVQMKRMRVKPTTARGYNEIMVQHVIPRIGDLLLQKVTAAQLQAFEDDLLLTGRLDGNGGLSRTYGHDIHVALKMAFAYAVKLGYLARNTLEDVSPPKIRHPPIAVWDETQARAFLRIAEQDGYWPLWLVALATGMRRGELLALRWQHVDLKAGEVQVQENLTYVEGDLRIDTPKSGHGRIVSIEPRVVRALTEHRTRQKALHLQVGAGWTDQTHVFSSAVGTPIHPHNATAAFSRLLKRHPDIARIRFHDLRHTCATLLLKNGVHPKVVSEMLGHASIGITLSIYGHVLPHMQKDAARILGNILLDPTLDTAAEGDSE